MMQSSSAAEAEALNQPGELFRHKHGGIYRLLAITSIRNSDLKWKGDRPHVQRGQQLATYEHLWPHPREQYQRPYDEFAEEDRFRRIIRSIS
jgi:hypothetical protein